jgi:N-acetylmuramoyl-L-alanine amidase
MDAFDPRLRDMTRERDAILDQLMNASPDNRPAIKAEFDRVQTRIDEIRLLRSKWIIGALDAVIDRLESIVREERQRMSSIVAPIEDLLSDLGKEDKASTLPPADPTPGLPPLPVLSAESGFRRDALAALADREARRELVLSDPQAEQYVQAFKSALTGWRTMAWCAAFVHWCCNQLGASLPVFVPNLPDGLPGVPEPTFAYNIAWKAWAQKNGWFHRRDGFTPAAGDLVAFDWESDGRNDHIAVVLGLDQGDLMTAEGNTRNSKGVRNSSARRRRKMSVVDGFIRLPDGLNLAGASGTGAAVAPPPVTATATLASATGQDADVLARTLWGEARGDGEPGMEAVACVILNRVRRARDSWGKTVAEVCKKDRQFSCWNVGDPNREKMLAVREDDAAFKQALAVANRAIAGTLADVTVGATHYHTRAVRPNWSVGKTPCFERGDHVFFNDIS